MVRFSLGTRAVHFSLMPRQERSDSRPPLPYHSTVPLILRAAEIAPIRGDSGDRPDSFPLQGSREARRTAKGVVYGAEDAEVNLAVVPKGIHWFSLANQRRRDHRQPAFLLIPLNTLLTQTLLTPRCRASSVWLAKPPSASIRRYLCCSAS